MRQRPFAWFIPLVCLALAGCGQVYNVSPRPVSPPAELRPLAPATPLEISALAITEDARAFAQFGANLPLAGLLAIDLSMTNRMNGPLDLRAVKFALRDDKGRNFKQLTSDKAFKRLRKFYRQRIFGLEGYRTTLANLQALSLAREAPLNAGEERRGMLFFETKQDVAALRGLTLSMTGQKQAAGVNLSMRIDP